MGDCAQQATSLNHAVLIVGYGVEKSGTDDCPGKGQYWNQARDPPLPPRPPPSVSPHLSNLSQGRILAIYKQRYHADVFQLVTLVARVCSSTGFVSVLAG